MTRVLICGLSTRAAAESAARAGYDVTAVDAFADLDQHPSVRARAVSGRFTALTAAKTARNTDADAVVYLASFENHPRALRVLAEGRPLWGNSSDVLRRVRDPIAVAQTLRQHWFATPVSYVASGFRRIDKGSPADKVRLQPDATYSHERWLVKPLASGGGRRVRPWHPTDEVPRGCYLQELIDGTPGSVVFVAAGGRAVPIGVSRQLIGEDAFGAAGYEYCGNILASAGDAQFAQDAALFQAACALARTVVAEFGVVGVNGIDFVARNGVPYVVEINPRWCASMDLVERAYALSVFGVHAAACRDNALPDFDLATARYATAAVGSAVVFARRDVTVGDTRVWLQDDRVGADPKVRDIPRPGERIRAGRPVCTVCAAARDSRACYAALRQCAEAVYAQLAAWDPRSRVL